MELIGSLRADACCSGNAVTNKGVKPGHKISAYRIDVLRLSGKDLPKGCPGKEIARNPSVFERHLSDCKMESIRPDRVIYVGGGRRGMRIVIRFRQMEFPLLDDVKRS